MLPWHQTYRSLKATGNERNCWEVIFPAHCLINLLTCVQVSAGPRADFRLRMFNSRRPCASGSQSSGGVGDPDGYYEADPASYEVIPVQESGHEEPGTLRYEPAVDRAYQNADGEGPSTREHRAYIEIIPLTDGEFAYDVSVSCQIGTSG